MEKHFNDYVTLEDLNNLLDSPTAELAKVLDSSDGSYDGMIKTSVINSWRATQGLSPDTFGQEIMPFLDAIKYIRTVQTNELGQGNLRPE
jgi:hypothetical protein